MSLLPARDAGQIPEWTASDRLRKAREFAALEQTELAGLAGISRATISAAENGRPISRASMRLWALACGVSYEWVETGVHPLGLEPRTHWFRVGRLAEVLSIDSARSVRELVIA
jgi:transcriptional regulator with XRE-family HTH domain